MDPNRDDAAVHLHLDPVGGIAGDMFAAALIDLAPDAARELVPALRAAGLSGDVAVSWSKVEGEILAGTHFRVDDPRERRGARPPHHAVLQAGHDAHAAHVRYSDIRVRLERSGLAAPVITRAQDIFGHLARAEASVHGFSSTDDVVFHEVGAQDSIADVVAAAFLLETLRVTSSSLSSLPLGSGLVKTAHGMLPVPAPATTLLLQGFATHDDGLKGERVTPTGAAIVAHLQPAPRKPGGVLRGSGTGWGTKRFSGTPNVLRVLWLDAAPALEAPRSGTVGALSFEIDDQTGEDLAVALDHVRAMPGVLDVVQAPLFGKKGRMMVGVRVLCLPEVEEPVIAACLNETTTLGVRVERVRRVQLERSLEQEGGVRFKRVTRPDGTSTRKAEMDDVAQLTSHAARQEKRR